MQLETQRLLIRLPRVQDVDDYMSFCNSAFVLRYNAMTVKSREAVEKQFAQADDSKGTYVLEHKQSNRVIGVVCIEEDSLRWDVASRELAYFIREDHARQGYMREALCAVIGHLFDTETLACISARSFAPNVASRNLLASLGFHQDGLIRRCVKGYGDVVFDDAVYSLMRQEWNP